MTCMLFCVYFYIFHWILNCRNQADGCTSTTVQHKRIGEDVTIRFQARMINTENSALFVTNQILSNDDTPLHSTVYQNGVNILNSTCNDCTFTGNSATGDLSVRLENLQPSSGGTYKHSITEASRKVEGCVKVYILGVPGQPKIPADRNVTEGSNIKLICSGSKSTTIPRDPNLTLQFKWRVNNTVNPVDTRYVYSNLRYTLTINNIEKQDANKTFTCEATESGPGITGLTSASSDVYRMNVLYGPDRCNINMQSPYVLTEGSTPPVIMCRSDCYPSCSHVWKNISTGMPIGSKGELQLTKVTRYDSGYYNCTCQNTATNVYKNGQISTLEIIVEYRPDVNILQSTTNITEGNPLIMLCNATGFPPVYNFRGLQQRWEGSLVPNTHSAVTGTAPKSSLHIPSLLLQDSGTYTCYVNNGVKIPSGVLQDSTASVFIKVKVAPKIRSRILRFAGVTEGSVNIQIQFYSFPDIQTFSFARLDGLRIENSTSNKYAVSSYSSVVQDDFYGTDVELNGSVASLYITNLIEEDFSNYTLTLTNEVGTTFTHLTLSAESKPSDPAKFRNIYKDGTHIFTWVSGFNGGHEQTFVIQISSYESEEWGNLTMVTEQTQSHLSSDVTYQWNVSHLLPGKYNSRLYSWNILGRTGYVILNTTITITDSRQEKFVSKAIPIAVGVTSSIVVVVVVVALVLFIWRRKFHQKDGSKEDGNRTKMEVETELDNSYYNLSRLEERTASENSGGHYETLQGNTEAHTSQHYESLQRQGEASSTYTSLTTDNNTPVSSMSPDGPKIYVNLKLQGTAS